MIIYDETADELFGAHDFQLDTKSLNSNVYSVGYQYIQPSKVFELTIEISTEKYQYVKDWESSMYNYQTGISYSSSNYKRTIYIVDKKTTKFIGTWIAISEITNNSTILLKLSCDYYLDGQFPELKEIYRDKKIDELLS